MVIWVEHSSEKPWRYHDPQLDLINHPIANRFTIGNGFQPRILSDVVFRNLTDQLKP